MSDIWNSSICMREGASFMRTVLSGPSVQGVKLKNDPHMLNLCGTSRIILSH